MPFFSYEAVDNQGKETRGDIEATSEKEATDKLRQRGLFPTKVAPKGARVGPAGGSTAKRVMAVGRASGKMVTQFTRQFATLQDAGLPIVRSLDILEAQFRPGSLKSAIGLVREDVEGGTTLSEAMAKYPKVWDSLYVSMIRAGEVGGVLDVILSRLADFREKSERLRRKIIGTLIYPAIVVTIAILVVAVIMVFIVPKFAEMYKNMNVGDLPTLTVMLTEIAHALAPPVGPLLLVAIPVAAITTWKLIGMSAEGRFMLDKFMLTLPVFGQLVRKTSVARFCRTLGTLIGAGVPILDALRIIQGTVGNAVVARAVEKVHESIREGDPIAEPLRNSGVFDDIVVNMIAVGEETGELEKMLTKVADNFDTEVDSLVGDLMSVLEPMLIVFMGVTVGFIVVALFMPMTSLIEKLASAK